ncbi:MAG: CoA transferase [Candidatus Latescibacteria bacterium]|nr:CoA transferase [Candidatus Latescibacterota bacterium]
MRKALDGLRVLDLTRVYAGPYCTMVLADMGAEVIKVENPAGGDDTRRIGPYKDHQPGEERSGYFAMLNRNKYGVTLNLKHPTAIDLFIRLVTQADVVVENYAPGTMQKFGLGWEVLQQANPRVILASISGYGQTGPLSARPSYDGNAQALSGLMSLIGAPDGPPMRVNPAIGDSSAAIHAAFGILCAVYARERTGRGQWVDVAQLDAVFSIMESAVVNYTLAGNVLGRVGSRHQDVCVYDVFRCRDGYVYLGAYKPHHWGNLCRLLDRPGWVTDPRTATNDQRLAHYEGLIKPVIEAWAAHHDADALVTLLDAESIPCAKVQTVDQAVHHPQLRARDMVVPVAHPVMGRIELPGITCKLSDTPGGVDRPPPLLGEHNAEVYGRLLGLTADELVALRRDGVI